MLDPDYREASAGSEWNLQTHGSVLVEKVLEYQFLAALTPELLRRGLRFEVLRGDSDLHGHDVVIEADGIIRHIQLKGTVEGGKRSRVEVNTRLQRKSSGCVVWATYSPATFAITGWRWFGASPGHRLPNLGDRVAKQTRGRKALRPEIRVLSAGSFSRVEKIEALADRLFGTMETIALRRHLRSSAESGRGWLAEVQAGCFAAVPVELDWDQSIELAHLIDGYELAGELSLGDPVQFTERQLALAMRTGTWAGNAAELWVTLFLVHRRWRFAAPHEPDAQM